MTIAPTNVRASPITAMRTCHAGRLSRSSSRTIPIRIATTGFATETVATDGASRPVPSETCWTTKPSTPATARA